VYDEGAKLVGSDNPRQPHALSRQLLLPGSMGSANSDALFAVGDLSAAIGSEYKGQCEVLCFGPDPSWEIVQARFMELWNLL
jgi:hypothetical protein